MARPDLAETSEQPPMVPLELLRRDVDTVLERFMGSCSARAPDPGLPPLIEVVRDFQAGGKRLRPLFCCAGFAAAGGDPRSEVVLGVAAALELFHSFALIHDDVMDGSDQRRGKPTVHRRFGAQVPEQRGAPGASGAAPAPVDAGFGVNVAILLGDACLVWSDELLHSAGIPQQRWADVRPFVQAMRTELIAGQYLDLAGEGALDPLDQAWRVIRHKTAAYTVARPMQIGAALAGADRELLARCAEFGFLLGTAFQLRDDLLGVFGDPAVTGKSRLDDLRAGKPTVLIGLTWRRATEQQRRTIRRLHGAPGLDEEGAAQLRGIIDETGAHRAVRELIEQRTAEALGVLWRMPVRRPVRESLAELAGQATRRQR